MSRAKAIKGLVERSIVAIFRNNALLIARHDYQRAQQRVNYGLHRLSEEYGIVPAITMYVARHSWTTRARDLGTPLSVISSCLGHQSISTTEIYLATIDTATLDKANQKILKDLGV